MKKLITGRGEGKTHEAIREANSNWAYIIVLHREEAKRVAQEAEKLGLDIPYPITIDEYLKYGLRGSRVRNIVIDNLDQILSDIFRGLNIKLVTMTEENHV